MIVQFCNRDRQLRVSSTAATTTATQTKTATGCCSTSFDLTREPMFKPQASRQVCWLAGVFWDNPRCPGTRVSCLGLSSHLLLPILALTQQLLTRLPRLLGPFFIWF